MYSEEIKIIRRHIHHLQNYSNCKRKKQGKHAIDSFPKSLFKFPEDPTKLKTFLIYDELKEVKKMSAPDLLMYFFRNMLIYESNLIFDNNFQLDYNFNAVDISLKDFREFFPRLSTKTIKNCERNDNVLTFYFDYDLLRSLNKKCVQEDTEDPNAKARQYIIITFGVIISAFDKLSPKCKDFLLFIIERYHYSHTPIIKHSFKSMLKECNISIHEGKEKALKRINKYLMLMYAMGVLGDNYGGYRFKIEDLECTAPLNIQLRRIDHYYDDN